MSNQEKQVTLIIDGKPVTVSEGTLLIQACEKAGSPVPFYCYHPGLSVAGNCRICLVEMKGGRRPEISCNTRVKEGMIVETASDLVLEARQSVLEYLLINHPLDCPVCDQAGECWLQDYYMQHGLYDPKFDEEKNKKPKKVPLGPTVMLDAERCILCSRCVRFTDEITKTGEFGIFNRGEHAEVGLHPGKTLDNKYSGNVVDICPVGALTDRDFRFKCRVWYLGSTKSVCPGCSRGCNIFIHYNRERDWRSHIAEGARIMRLKPRYNADVNQWWMCDAGRYGYKLIDQDRIERARIRKSGRAYREAPWDEALNLVADKLNMLRRDGKADQIGVVLSSRQTNEDLFAAKKFFKAIGKAHIAFGRPKAGDEDGFLIRSDKSPNARGAEALGIAEGVDQVLNLARGKRLRLLVAFTEDLTEVFGEAHLKEVVTELDMFVFVGAHHNRTSQHADITLPGTVYAEKEGTFVNLEGRIQRIHASVNPLADARSEWQIVSQLSAGLGLKISFADAQATFTQLAQEEKAFNGFTYELIGEQGAMLKL